MKKNIHTIIVIFVVTITLSATIYYDFNTHKPLIKISKQESALNINTKTLTHFNFGLKRLISSLLWVQTLIESDIEHYNRHDSNSWMFLRFNNIISIDPKFYEAYLYGGQYLSVIKDDDIGAEILFRKGLEVFPNDFWLNFYGAFHYYFELGDAKSALKHYEKIQFHNITNKNYQYIPSLVAKIKRKLNYKLEDIYELVLAAYRQAPKGSLFKRKYRESLNNIKIEIDLNCLNLKQLNQKKRCNIFDPLGVRYTKDSTGKYYTTTNWKKFSFTKNKKRSK